MNWCFTNRSSMIFLPLSPYPREKKDWESIIFVFWISIHCTPTLILTQRFEWYKDPKSICHATKFLKLMFYPERINSPFLWLLSNLICSFTHFSFLSSAMVLRRKVSFNLTSISHSLKKSVHRLALKICVFYWA